MHCTTCMHDVHCTWALQQLVALQRARTSGNPTNDSPTLRMKVLTSVASLTILRPSSRRQRAREWLDCKQ